MTSSPNHRLSRHLQLSPTACRLFKCSSRFEWIEDNCVTCRANATDNNPHKGVKPDQTQYNPGFSMGCPQKRRKKKEKKERNLVFFPGLSDFVQGVGLILRTCVWLNSNATDLGGYLFYEETRKHWRSSMLITKHIRVSERLMSHNPEMDPPEVCLKWTCNGFL